MKAKPYKGYSDREIEYFRKRVAFWQTELGQTDWEIYTGLQENDGDWRARVEYNSQGRSATVILNLSNRSPACDKSELDMFAFHEILHLVFCDLYNLVPDKKREQADRYEHRVIRILENAFI